MIKVKTLDPGITAPHWYMGAEHMRRVSFKTARGLAGMYPLPEIGCEIVVAIKPNTGRLYLANIAGRYWVKCAEWSIGYWPDIFGVEVQL